MKHKILLMSIWLPLISMGQISLTANEMPVAGDTARFTNAVVNPLINYGATGVNHTWNFANLRNNGQDLKNYKSVTSTGIIYALFFSNLPFNPNRATVAEAGQQLPSNPLLTIDNPYNFYFRSNSVYKQVGMGAEIAGIPTPITYSQHDVIYNLPLHYNDNDTSYSAWHIGLPGLGYYGFSQTRINKVDGWGTIITPRGTYDVLRVKTQLFAKDTIAVDTLNLHFALNRPKVTQYKWLANNEVIPVLQITTTEILGLEVVTEIFYRDDYNKIQTTPLNSAYCAGSAIEVPFVANGSYNGSAFLQPANVFTAQLSDANGSFANPVSIGTLTSRVSGTISATIPANTPTGTGYRIRVVSSSPSVIGTDNGEDFSIENTPVSAISANGPLTFCENNSVVLQSVNFDPGYTYQWMVNNTNVNSAISSNHTATSSGIYTLNITNSCGSVVSNSLAVNVNPLPIASVTSSSPVTFCDGGSVLLNTLFDSTLTYQWLLNGISISGETSNILQANLSGDYKVAATNGCGTTTSVPISVVVESMPVAGNITTSTTTLCLGDSLMLNSSTSAPLIEWYLNNQLIAGAGGNSYYATVAGDYTIVASNTCGADTSAILSLMQGTPPVAVVTSSGALTFCDGDSVILTASTGNDFTYQWLLDGVYTGDTSSAITVNSNGLYHVEITNSCGTSASVAVQVIVHSAPVLPQISLVSDSLICTPALTYQWYLNNQPIAGANTPYFIPSQNGDYTVSITDSNGCSSISLVYTMTTVGLQTNSAVIKMSLFPNPFKDVLYVSHPENTTVDLFSADGRLVYSSYFSQKQLSAIATENLSKGVYYLRLSTNNETVTGKVIKN